MRTLFVSWDGPGPNYLESLFMPIFAGLQVQATSSFDIIQYAWDSMERSVSIAQTAEALGMPYTVHKVWSGPQAPVTAAMMVRGALDVIRYVRRHRIQVLMPRSIIPAGMCLLALRVLPDVRLLYDADGLKADERVDFGGWSQEGRPYRILNAIERAAVRRADVVVTRTQRAKQILTERAGDTAVAQKIVVISNGKDSARFSSASEEQRAEIRRELGLPLDAPLVIYAGSLGPHYHPDRMMKFFNMLSSYKPDARFIVLTGTPEPGERAARAEGLAPTSYSVRCVHPGQVPAYLAAADLGLAFREPSFSQQAVAPIKVGEYLLCGLPVFSTCGVGDLDSQLDASVGRLVDSLSDGALEAAARWFVDEVLPQRAIYRDRCRRRGLEHFSLERSVDHYSEAFHQIEQSLGGV